jgi:hypothetical protein
MEGDDDTLGMLSAPFEVRIQQQFWFISSCSKLILAFQSPNVSTTPKCATALAEFNGDIPSTDNHHPLRLLLEIEEVIRVDAKRPSWDLRVLGGASHILGKIKMTIIVLL